MSDLKEENQKNIVDQMMANNSYDGNYGLAEQNELYKVNQELSVNVNATFDEKTKTWLRR